MVTAEEVAAKAGVSRATVSYVISGRKPISEKTKQRVRKAMEDLGYVPNANARALAGRRSYMIGVVTTVDARMPVDEFAPYFLSILDAAHARGYEVVLIPKDEGMGGIRRLTGQSLVDGLIVFDIERHDERLPQLVQLGVPVVLFGTPEDSHGLICVDPDHRSEGRMCVDELARVGSQRIIYVGDRVPVRDRFLFSSRFERSVVDVAARADVAVDVYHPGTADWRGMEGLKALLAEGASARYGIITRTTWALELVLDVLKDLGLVPGRDVAMTGVCPDDYVDRLRVPLSNVDQRAQEQSRIGAAALLDMIEGKPVPSVTSVQPVFTARATTDMAWPA